ncbi:sin3 histone deacetylase corepressor complex component SDS3 isoform X2 [Contarinia nasturtii]|uniref:sin3 histone deacetylase corepressor complex component SDS3 isoform X2 n=1 Tax=Contarinia nasturtii TaxID=265458 RepID=UPI0012D3FFAB|nr:sin3 histone deacetylase corepressor complex component SDS3 isoform X2 [Contarinia nasturtii]
MAYVGISQYNHNQQIDEYEYDDTENFYDDEVNFGNYLDVDDSEDTEEASESEYGHTSRNPNEPLEIKELMYQDKLSNLKKQLEQLKNDVHPEYIRRYRKLEKKKAALKEFDEKRADLKENLIAEFEDKRKQIEAERHSMELTGDSTETKPTVTRKLRRRPNDPIPAVAEKRRKPTVSQLVLLLDDKEIENDLKLISRGKQMTTTPIRSPSVNSNGLSALNASLGIASCSLPPTENYSLIETKIEDGKLLFERRWYHRGQPVYIEGKDIAKFAATISAIGNEVVWVKKLNDNNKVKIPTSHLSRGKITIKRRAN